MKKLFAILLTATIMASAFSVVGANAVEDTTQSATTTAIDLSIKKENFSNDSYSYSIVTEEAEHSKVTYATFDKILDKDAESFTIPDTIDGEMVTIISSEAFKDCKNLKQVTLGKYATNIEARAFKGCVALKKINFDNVGYVGVESFNGCTKLTEVDLTTGEYSKNLKVDSKAFYNCKKLKTVKIYDEATIGTKAFGYYKNGNTKYDKVKNFTLVLSTDDFYYDNESQKDGIKYCHDNNFQCTYNLNLKDKEILYMQSGFEGKFTIDGGKLYKSTSNDPDVLKISITGKFTALEKGIVTINGLTKKGHYSKVIEVIDSPSLSKTNITVKKGSVYSIKLNGKANSIDNIYTNTKTAKIISKASAKTIKIKGLKKGKTTLKVKVNGQKTIKIKVKVKG